MSVSYNVIDTQCHRSLVSTMINGLPYPILCVTPSVLQPMNKLYAYSPSYVSHSLQHYFVQFVYGLVIVSRVVTIPYVF